LRNYFAKANGKVPRVRLTKNFQEGSRPSGQVLTCIQTWLSGIVEKRRFLLMTGTMEFYGKFTSFHINCYSLFYLSTSLK